MALTPEEALEAARQLLHKRAAQQEKEEEGKLYVSIPSAATVTTTTLTAITLTDTSDQLPPAHDGVTPMWARHCGQCAEFISEDEWNIFTGWKCGRKSIDDVCGCGYWITSTEPIKMEMGQCGECSYVYHTDNIPKKVVMWNCDECDCWYETETEALDCCS